MGVDAAELNETIDPATGYRVTATAGALPWERAIPTIKKAALEIYAVLNGTLKICPTSMEGWFQGYTALTSFDGTNFDTSLLTSNTASLDNLFNGCTALRTLNLTNWNWQATGVSHVDMFKDLNSITKITLETGALRLMAPVSIPLAHVRTRKAAGSWRPSSRARVPQTFRGSILPRSSSIVIRATRPVQSSPK